MTSRDHGRAWPARSVLALSAAAVLAVVASAGAILVVRTDAADVARGDERRLDRIGVTVPVPEGWTEKAPENPSTSLELEQKVLGGRIATRGLWVSRWSEPEGTDVAMDRWRDEGWIDGPEIAGMATLEHVEVIGPAFLRRLPAAVTLRRVHHRFVAFGRIYEVGFWGPSDTIGDEVERSVIRRVRVAQPAPIELRGDGWSVTAPWDWDRGDRCGDRGSVCAFAPFQAGKPPRSWLYVIPWAADSLEGGTERLRTSIGKGANVRDLRDEPTEVAGRAGVRFRFTLTDSDGAGTPGEIEELLVPAGGGFVVVAMGWRSPEGRAELDSVLQTLRL